MKLLRLEKFAGKNNVSKKLRNIWIKKLSEKEIFWWHGIVKYFSLVCNSKKLDMPNSNVVIRSGRPKSSTTEESFMRVKDKIIDDRPVKRNNHWEEEPTYKNLTFRREKNVYDRSLILGITAADITLEYVEPAMVVVI